MKTWYCKIGEATDPIDGADNTMRSAVERTYEWVIGEKPAFIFSGWGGELTEAERAVVENRPPDPYKMREELLSQLVTVQREIELRERHP